ncbi:MAG: ATP-binding protein [Elusimicrobiota bacterium]
MDNTFQSVLKKRKLVSHILKFIPDDEIIVIHGSRQVGKTSLLRFVMDNHLKKISDERNIFYFDLEDFSLLELCNSSPEEVLSYLKAKNADLSKRIYLIIDEIQYMKNPSSFLKLFHDRYKKKVKLIVSGSSSMLIKKKFKVSLVGRTVDFELFTLDFEEFIDFKSSSYNLAEKLPETMSKELKTLYKEYVVFGGYPAIVLEENIEKKEIKLKQIITTYIKKDIRDIADIRDIDKFNDLVKILALQTGKLIVD